MVKNVWERIDCPSGDDTIALPVVSYDAVKEFVNKLEGDSENHSNQAGAESIFEALSDGLDIVEHFKDIREVHG